MVKIVIGLLTALFVSGFPFAYGQEYSSPMPSQQAPMPSPTDFKVLTDARIGIVKAALQLTPEQAKYWPAVEEAIRNRAMGRQTRLTALARQREQGDGDPIDMVRHRADALAQRSAELKQLADAWQPLYSTLSSDQKQRLRVYAIHILRMVPKAIELRRMQNEDESDED